jgi:hypothetical protein
MGTFRKVSYRAPILPGPPFIHVGQNPGNGPTLGPSDGTALDQRQQDSGHSWLREPMPARPDNPVIETAYHVPKPGFRWLTDPGHGRDLHI